MLSTVKKLNVCQKIKLLWNVKMVMQTLNCLSSVGFFILVFNPFRLKQLKIVMLQNNTEKVDF